MSARKVRGPTFSERVRRSQSRRCSSVRRVPLPLIPSARSSLRSAREPLDVFSVLPPEERHNKDEDLRHPGLAEAKEDDRRRRARDQGRKGRVPGREGAGEPDRHEGERRPRLKADQAADEGRDALAALEPEPDGEEVADECAERPQDRRVRPPQPGQEEDGDGSLEGIADKCRRGETFATCAKHIRRADIARARPCGCRRARQNASAGRRTGLNRTRNL